MKKVYTITSLGVLLALLAILIGPPLQVAQAAALLNHSDTMSSLKGNTASNHTHVFRTPTGAADATDTITIEYDKGAGAAFTIPGALDFTDLSLEHSAGGQTNCTSATTYTNNETLAATPSATAWGVSVNNTTDIITLTAPTDGVGVAAIAANACVRIKVGTNASGGDQQITNPDITTATNYTIAIGGTFGDSGDVVVQILLDDQVAVSGTVVETMTFTIDDNSIGFGNLTASNARFATGNGAGANGPTSVSAHTMTMATNAAYGYSIRYNGATLTSGGNTITVATITGDEDGTPGSEQFAIGFTTNGNATIASAYNQVSPTFNYSFVASTETEVISETGPTATETFSAFYLANITGATEAGSYTTAITYTATANF